MTPDQVLEITDALALLPWRSILGILGAAVVSTYLGMRLRAAIARQMAWKKAQKSKAIESDYVKLRDQNIWLVREIERDFVTLTREEITGTGQNRRREVHTTWIPTEAYSSMQITKVHTESVT
jgi:hypothetical protein